MPVSVSDRFGPYEIVRPTSYEAAIRTYRQLLKDAAAQSRKNHHKPRMPATTNARKT